MQSTEYYTLACEIFMVTMVLCKHTKLFRENLKEESNLFQEKNIYYFVKLILWNALQNTKVEILSMTFKIPKTREMILNFIPSVS